MDNENWVAAVVAFAAAVVAFAAAVAAFAAVAFAAAVVAFAAFAAAFAALAALDDDYKKSISISRISLLLSVLSFAITYGNALDFSFFTTLDFALLFLVVMEIFFLLDRKMPGKSDNHTIFALKRKVPASFKALGCIFAGNIVIQLGKNYWHEILKWIGYIGAGAIVLAAIAGVIWLVGRLNALKYSSRAVSVRKGANR